MSNERGRAPLSLCAVTRTVHTVWGRGTLLKALVHLYIRCTRALAIAPGVGRAHSVVWACYVRLFILPLSRFGHDCFA
jgi:hypothetical protein